MYKHQVCWIDHTRIVMTVNHRFSTKEQAQKYADLLKLSGLVNDAWVDGDY